MNEKQEPVYQQSLNQENPNGSFRSKEPDEKFCASCGQVLKKKIAICPNCNAKQKGVLSKTALLLITFFLGGIGGHKFYTGKHWQGFFYLIFCWTSIPSLIALVEFVIYAFTSSEKLQEKYVASGSGAVFAIVGVGFFFLIGIMAAISIPAYMSYVGRARLTSELNNLLIAEQAYFSERGTYSSNMHELNLNISNPEVSIELINADTNCFEATATHSKSKEQISVDCNGIK
jgi:TM2 domain-containing membrane protein YozV